MDGLSLHGHTCVTEHADVEDVFGHYVSVVSIPA